MKSLDIFVKTAYDTRTALEPGAGSSGGVEIERGPYRRITLISRREDKKKPRYVKERLDCRTRCETSAERVFQIFQSKS
jgi:hypothetical protein